MVGAVKRGRVASDRVSGFKGVGSQVTDRTRVASDPRTFRNVCFFLDKTMGCTSSLTLKFQ